MPPFEGTSLTTWCHRSVVGAPTTPVVPLPAALEVLLELTGPLGKAWTERPWRQALLYFARGPQGTIKVGRSVKPRERMARLDAASTVAKRPEAIGLGEHRLVLLIDGGGLHRERELHRVLAAERVAGEWFRGELTERLCAELLARAVPLREFYHAA